MASVSRDPARDAYVLLRIVFIAAPIIAGLDKFLFLLAGWGQYVSPMYTGFGTAFLSVVGIVEIICGIGVIFKPRIFAFITGVWLALVILNILILGNYYDIALRDLGLCLSAFALARLADVYS